MTTKQKDADSAAPKPIEDQLTQPIRNFDVNEQVLVCHKGLIYEAKILKTIFENDIFIYRIHYSGWSKKWDEWVSEAILLKLNEANLEKQKVLKEERQKSSKKKISLKAKSKSLTPSGDTSSIGKRRKTDTEDNDASLNTSSVLGSSLNASASTSNSEAPSSSRLVIKPNLSASEGTGQTSIFQKLLPGIAIPGGQSLQDGFEKVEMPEDTTNGEQQSQSNEELGQEYRQYQEVIIKIPEGLKKVLVDDWFEIRKKKKIINLPIDPSRNIDAILHEYETSSDNTWKNIELGEGFRDYIEGILRTKLLYKDEKDQNIYFNSQIQSKELSIRTEYSRIYGAVHLIRLMSQLGHWLSYYPLDAFSKTYLEDSISEFTVFLDSKKEDYVKSEDYVLIKDYNYTFLYNSEGDDEKAVEENNEGTESNNISVEGDEEKDTEKNNEGTEVNSNSMEGDEEKDIGENNEGTELNSSMEGDEEKDIGENNEGTELNSSMEGDEEKDIGENNEGTEVNSISVESDEENAIEKNNEGTEVNSNSMEGDEENAIEKNNEGTESNSISSEGDEENAIEKNNEGTESNSISSEGDEENAIEKNNEGTESNSISSEGDEENAIEKNNEGTEVNSISVESDEENAIEKNNEGTELNSISVEGDEEKDTEKNNEGAEVSSILVEGGLP